MCKHIFIRELQESDTDIINRFIELSEYERDGFGYILRTKNNELEYLKSIDIGSFYLSLGKRLARNDIRDIVVHHRTSTNGEGVEYSHPFLFQGNLLTHNGVVNVPGKHNTATLNDSEMLLHHLIKTSYDTESIQGYFSCFILNELESIVLVDDKAPIYKSSCHRIYSSHKLGETWEKVMLKKVTYPIDSAIPIVTDIKVSVSTYGNDKRHLSLANSTQTHDDAWDNIDVGNVSYEKSEYFLDALNDSDYAMLDSCRNERQLTQAIKSIAETLGLDLEKTDIENIKYYVGRYSYA